MNELIQNGKDKTNNEYAQSQWFYTAEIEISDPALRSYIPKVISYLRIGGWYLDVTLSVWRQSKINWKVSPRKFSGFLIYWGDNPL